MTERNGWSLDMSAGPIFQQIAQNVRRSLARGDLVPGEKLPSARELAQHLGVNPNTVVHAYGKLEAEEVIETRRGLGTFVREDAPVAATREALVQSAARRFVDEVRRLGLSDKAAIAALKEVLGAGEAR
ncbi:MAG: GntR family transcriptional regulator [Candidatus Bipolaricaulota bacterium]|jgi:GntR family transcriptional regulator|nr:GntR family transcriptional regulator [Candidatus Bipolaricaulota bacterium]